jgi:hypothetical protein
MGSIAALPEECVPLTMKKGEPSVDCEAYLIEARSIGGFSGSPVFVRETVYIPGQAGGERHVDVQACGAFFFLGLIHGHWRAGQDEVDETNMVQSDLPVNVGIAAVVPARKIWEILYQPKLVLERREQDMETKMANAPVPD